MTTVRRAVWADAAISENPGGVHRIDQVGATTTYRLDLDEAAAMYGVGKRAYPIPAVLLARLAVDVSFQGCGIGSKLLLHALRQIAEASQRVGFEIVVVHAIDRDAVTFYAQRGFSQFEDHDLHMFMPVKSLLATRDRFWN